MKQILPYNALLALAAVVIGLIVYFNLALRPSFGVMVGYTPPRPPGESLAEEENADLSPLQTATDVQQWMEEEAHYNAYEQQDVTVVLVTFPLDVNAASEEELQYVPRIGNVTAQRIVQYRNQLGGYDSLDQLKDIKGIGDKTFETIAPYLYVEGEWE